MPRLNFATRLMLAMMFIVTFVAGCIFAATGGSLETAWREIIETRFQSQTESLASMQKARLDSIQERCRELAASDTVIEAIESGSGKLPAETERELRNRAFVVQVSASLFDNAAGMTGGTPPGPGGPNLSPPPGSPPGGAGSSNSLRQNTPGAVSGGGNDSANPGLNPNSAAGTPAGTGTSQQQQRPPGSGPFPGDGLEGPPRGGPFDNIPLPGFERETSRDPAGNPDPNTAGNPENETGSRRRAGFRRNNGWEREGFGSPEQNERSASSTSSSGEKTVSSSSPSPAPAVAAAGSNPASEGSGPAPRQGSFPNAGGAPDGRRFQGFGQRFRWGRPDSVDLALMDASGRLKPVRIGGNAEAQALWLEKNKISRVPASQEVAYMAVKPEMPAWPPPAASFSARASTDSAANPPSSANPANPPAAGTSPLLISARPPMPQPPPELREVIITPIKKPGLDEAIGALIVGLRVSTYGESALYDLNRQDKPGELFTGLWIDDQLFSRTIPSAVQNSVSTVVRNTLASGPPDEHAHVGINIDGKPYQILFRSLNAGSSTPQAWQITLFSLAGLVAEKNDIRGQIILYSALAFAAAVILSWLLSRRLVHPVQALVEGTRKIKNGLYDTRVEVSTRDELATLASSFNEMAEGLRMRERYRDILFQVSDDDIARQLIETASLGGERREISVLFCDIRSFTATTSGMAPEGIIDMLNEHMTALTDLVHKHHGVVDKFVGDLIMAIFGAPKSYGDDAGNAAACALEMVARREELNRTTAHPPLLMGIGIASGTAVAGCMGSENRLNYTVLGEPVNLASRLCSAAGPREIILDPHTVHLLHGRAVGHVLKPLLLKGFPDPVQPFHLTRLAAAPKSQHPEPHAHQEDSSKAPV